MNCQEMHDLVHPYADGELDLVRHLEVEEHVAACPACAEQLKRLLSLRTALSAASLYHRAPAALRARVAGAVTVTPARRRPWMRLAAAAAILLLLGTAATIGVLLSRRGPPSEERLADWVLAGHIRSLQVEHLTDMPSSDRHTVKPWFRGKLNFAPPVPDLAGDGYPLVGGRLDYLADRPVAALVYQRHAHVINVFLWPAGNEEEQGVHRLTRQGYHLRSWRQAGMTCWAVSDLNDEELDQFVRLFQEH